MNAREDRAGDAGRCVAERSVFASVEPCYAEAINPSAAQPLAGGCVDTDHCGGSVKSAGK